MVAHWPRALLSPTDFVLLFKGRICPGTWCDNRILLPTNRWSWIIRNFSKITTSKFLFPLKTFSISSQFVAQTIYYSVMDCWCDTLPQMNDIFLTKSAPQMKIRFASFYQQKSQINFRSFTVSPRIILNVKFVTHWKDAKKYFSE